MGKNFVKKLASIIEFAYQSCGICVKARFYAVSNNNQGLIFKLIPEIGTRGNAIFDRAEDIKTALQLPLFQPFKEGMITYLAVSGKSIEKSRLLTMLNSPTFRNSPALLPIALGYDLMGQMIIEDLAQMPHAMYVGATQSGKSTGLICLVLSLICRNPVNKASLVIVDIGGRTLVALQNVPHLSCPIITDTDTGIYAIKVLTEEMERRYALDDFELKSLPAIICVMDEYVSFIGNIAKAKQSEVENDLTNILRRGRKVNIHMVLATQNPSNSAMKAEMGNITSRMVFKVARFQDSVTSLNCTGAEKLPGNGAMLYTSMTHPEPINIQGAYISAEEIQQLVSRVRAVNQDPSGKFVIPEYVPSEDTPMSGILPEDAQDNSKKRQELAEIILWTLGRSDVSVDQIKREFSMGNRANGIMDTLCKLELVSEKFANQPRQVLPQTIEEVPDTVLQLLADCGIPSETVSVAISNQPCGDLMIPEGKTGL